MEQRKSKIGKLLFGIMDMIIVFIFLFPFLWMLSVSLQSEKEITTIPLTLIPKVPQWKNYVEAFASAPFLLYLRNSKMLLNRIILRDFYLNWSGIVILHNFRYVVLVRKNYGI